MIILFRLWINVVFYMYFVRRNNCMIWFVGEIYILEVIGSDEIGDGS